LVPLRGNRVTLLDSGTEYFPAIEAAIDAARRDVAVETYIYVADAVGERIAAALERAAARGVAVRVLLDAFGSRELPRDFLPALEAAGVRVQLFRPARSWISLERSRLRRLHRKIVVVDGRIAFVGGLNIIDDRTGNPTTGGRLDYAVRVEGPLVARIHAAVHRLWWLVATLAARRRQPGFRLLAGDAAPAGETVAAFVHRDNLRHRHDIEAMYLRGIRGARREVVIACAYFLPGWRVRRALMAAARRGVRVVLLLQGSTDHRVLQQASRVLYEALLERGIEIFEYRGGELHAKVGVVDERWATVGSSNLDPFSLVLAREANVVVFDEAFARELRASLEQELRNRSEPVRRMLWRRRRWPARLVGWISYAYARLAIGLAGIAGRWL
jgi:cardiolipin synthase